MDPNDVFHALLDYNDWLYVCLVEFFVDAPHRVLLFLGILDIQAFEVVEKRS